MLHMRVTFSNSMAKAPIIYLYYSAFH